VASVNLHGAPLNSLFTGGALSRRAGISIVSRAQFGDAVNAILGANFITNPLRLPVSLIQVPYLFSSDPSLSAHTTPCGTRLQSCAY